MSQTVYAVSTQYGSTIDVRLLPDRTYISLSLRTNLAPVCGDEPIPYSSDVVGFSGTPDDLMELARRIWHATLLAKGPDTTIEAPYLSEAELHPEKEYSDNHEALVAATDVESYR